MIDNDEDFVDECVNLIDQNLKVSPHHLKIDNDEIDDSIQAEIEKFQINIIADILSLTNIYYPNYDYFEQPNFVNEKINVSNFNFNGKCRNVFKYKKNNPKDLIFMTLDSKKKNKWKNQKYHIFETLEIMNHSIPRAKKVIVMYDEFILGEYGELFENFGFEIIKETTTKNKKNAAIDRYIQVKKYLEIHKNKYERIAITDVRDVYWFADGFQTLSPNEIVILKECGEKEKFKISCIDMSQTINYRYMKKTYGLKTARKFMKERKFIVNAGFVAGGFQHIMSFLEIIEKEINRMKNVLNIWGIDNSMMTYLYHNGFFDEMPLSLITVSQRFGFDVFGGFKYDDEKKSISRIFDDCAPVVRHKMCNGYSLCLS